VGNVASPVYEREDSSFGNRAVDVSYDYVLSKPLTRAEILTSRIGELSPNPFKGFMGTNYRIQSQELVSLLDELIRDRLVAKAVQQNVSTIIDVQRGLDTSIKAAERETARQLADFLSTMNPTAFEWLIRVLLLKLGYSEIVVTRPSNDGGVDLRAKLVVAGITNIETAVQVKRTNSVGRPTVQNLRGSLTAHETGLLVTSGTFTAGAIEEAREAESADGCRFEQLSPRN
jgi:restriction endonuclease Mrr